MSSRLRASLVLSWACLCGGALGALRTRQAAMHLLEKNRALEAVGVAPLPGQGHWATLVSWQPAGAGALFFGLSLGLGVGTLAAAWVGASRCLPGVLGKWTPWLCLAAPLWAAWAGDPALASMLAAVCAGAILALGRAHPPSAGRAALWAACCALVVLGLVPWVRAPEGAFAQLRDGWLFQTRTGLAINNFYYRWTLYPAETLKPLAALSQPTAVPLPGTAREALEALCQGALQLGLICLPGGSPGFDVGIDVRGGEIRLLRGDASVSWPREATRQREAWARLSTASDSSRPLRRATAWALFAGCPLALAGTVGSLCLWAGERFRAARLRVPAALLAAGAVASGLALASTARSRPAADLSSVAAVGQGLKSPDPAERFRAARAAAAWGGGTAPQLLKALEDPVINVRYRAAQSLGLAGGQGVEERLLALLNSPEDWYVKERAYAALWRIGWRPPLR